MLKPCLLAAVAGYCLLLATVSASAQYGPYLPPVEVSFEQGLAKAEGNQLHVARLLSETFYETREEQYEVRVKFQESVIDPVTKQEKTVTKEQPETRTRTVSVPRTVYKQIQLALDLGQITARGTDGTAIEAADLQQRLAKPTLVVFTNKGEPLPDSYAILFKPETIVLDLSKAASPYGMMLPAPVPAIAPPPGDAIPVPVPMPPPAAPAPAVAKAGMTLPNGAPPKFRLLSINDEDEYVVRTTATSKQTSTRMMMKTEKKVAEGKEIDVQVCMPVSVTELRETTHSVAYPALAVSGHTVDNKPLGDLHRAALKAREIPVIQIESKEIDPAWLQNIRPNMLVITTPGTAPFPAPAPLFAPPAPGAAPGVAIPPPAPAPGVAPGVDMPPPALAP